MAQPYEALVARFGVFDEAHKVLLMSIPKVACSVLKATVVMNSPRRDAYLASGKAIHDFIKDDRAVGGLASTALAAPGVFSFAVLREPGARMVSAYLNKFVRGGLRQSAGIMRDRTHATSVGQRLAGLAQDRQRGITFEEFVHFLAQAQDRELNAHWMPQTRFIGTDLQRYDHIGRFEQLAETFDMLERRFAYVTEREASVHLGGSKNNTTRYDRGSMIDAAYRCLPAELRAMRDGFPPADRFLTPALHDMLRKRFAEDARLHAAIVAGATLREQRPEGESR